MEKSRGVEGKKKTFCQVFPLANWENFRSLPKARASAFSSNLKPHHHDTARPSSLASLFQCLRLLGMASRCGWSGVVRSRISRHSNPESFFLRHRARMPRNGK